MAAVKIGDAQNLGLDEVFGGGRKIFRTSGGNLYFVSANTSATRHQLAMWKSTDGGTSWSEMNNAGAPLSPNTSGKVKAVSAAMDSSGNIHVFWNNQFFPEYEYIIFTTSTDTWGTRETVATETRVPTVYWVDITIDSNNKPHVTFVDAVGNMGTNYNTVKYRNKTGASWSAEVILEGSASSKHCEYPSITISDEDIPEIAYVDRTGAITRAGRGNQNNATSFTLFSVGTSSKTGVNNTPSIAIDSAGATYVTWINSTDDLLSRKNPDGADWTTGWDSAVTRDSTNNLRQPSLAIDGTDLYIFAIDDGNADLYYYKNADSRVALEVGTYKNPKAKWSLLNNNDGAAQIDVVFSDGTDAYWSKLVLVSGPETLTASHTLDALKKRQLTATHTLSSLLRKQQTATHSIDAYSVNRPTTTHTLDSLLKQRLTATHTLDAFKRATLTAVHTLDSLLRERLTALHTLDALKLARATATHTLSAFLRAVRTATHTLDTLLKIRQSATHSLDAFLTRRQTATHTLDALLRTRATVAHTLDTRLVERLTASHTLDSYLVLPTQTDTHTLDALLKKRLTADHTADAFRRAVLTSTHTTDALKREVLTASHSLDASLYEAATDSHTVDSFLKRRATVAHSADSLLRATLTSTHTLNSLLRASQSRTHALDSLLKARQSATHSLDAYIAPRTESEAHSLDAFLLTRPTRTHSLGSFLRAVRTSTHTTDALLRATLTAQHSLDTLLRQRATRSHTLNALLTLEAYSREAQSELAADNADLATLYTGQDKADVAEEDEVYVGISGSGYLTHQFKNQNFSNTSNIQAHWLGRSTRAASTSTVYLQVFNHDSEEWETVDFDDSAAADTPFSLEATITENVENYYDARNLVTFRIFQLI